MQRRSDMRKGEPQLQAVYSLPALAAFAKVHRHLLRRLLEAGNVRLIRSGRTLFVPLCEIQQKIPPLWKSICLIDRVRRAAESEAQQENGAMRPGDLASRRGK